MARGPRPTPTKLRLLKGNPGKRAINHEEPTPETVAELPVPSELTSIGQQKWNELTGHLAELGMLSAMDAGLIEQYCRKWEDWQASRKEIEKYGYVVKAPSGYPIQNPFVAIEKGAWRDLLRAGEQLGLSPSGRTRIRVKGGGAKQSKLSRFLANKSGQRARA